MYGFSGNDSIFGSSGFDYIYGGVNNDYLEDYSGGGKLYGEANDDTLVADKGECTLMGGSGDDTFVFASLTDHGHFAVYGGDSTLDGGSSANTGAYAGNDKIVAAGNNTVIGLKSITDIDLIDAQGHSNVTIETANTATKLDFSATTLTGISAINGLNGNDTIIGSSGNDSIFGGWSTDVLSGGAGNDTLVGAGGTLTGGVGADLFKSVGSVTVTDFDATQDHIFLTAGTAWTATAVTGGTNIRFASTGSIMTLLNVTPSQVQAGWFVST